MENLPRNLFDSEYYHKVHPDVAKAGADAYDHYFKFGLDEKRDACFNYRELSLDQLRCFYYHAAPNDIGAECWLQEKVPTLPFYLKSDIVLHLPIIEYYASRCNTITEFGIKNEHSTVSFLYSLPEDGKLNSYGSEDTQFVIWLKNKNLSKWTAFNLKDIKTVENTDLMFFNCAKLSEEFETHAHKAEKYLIFFNRNADIANKFADKYRIVYQTDKCGGLLILEKLK